MSGDPDRIRTCDPQIHHNYDFHRHSVKSVCVLDFLFIIPTEVELDANRQVSTPFLLRTWLGIAIS